MHAIETAAAKGSFGLLVVRNGRAFAPALSDMGVRGASIEEMHEYVARKGGRIGQFFSKLNLRTTIGFDYFADALGGAPGYTGQATATSATTLTDSGAAWTTNQWKGFRAVAALAATMVAGTIVSNTGTVLTVDAWKTIPTGAGGSTPGSTAVYSINARAHARYIAVSSDSGAASAADTSLASEVSSNGITRALGTYAHTASTSAYTVSLTQTASGTVSSLQKAGLFDASSGGLLINEALWTPTYPVTNLGNGDVATFQWALTLT